MNTTKELQQPTLRDSFLVFGKIGVLSFGGPAAQIALMHKMLVEEKKWLGEQQFLNALSFCMLLPGPEAMQLATYAGWRIGGTFGGLIAGLLFVLPGATVILALASIYALMGDVPFVSAIFLGIKAAVLIVVIEALLRVSKKALNGKIYWMIAFAAFVAIFFLALPYPLIIFAAAVFGFFYQNKASTKIAEDVSHVHVKTSVGKSLATIITWLAIWWVPILVVIHFSSEPILTHIATFFSKLAVVTFGGAYAVLAYMGQDVVTQFGWLSAGEMMDGLGLAETTPGPLILVTEFVGFIAAFREGGFLLGVMGAALTLWVTFIPCFLWIFVGAPYIDLISTQPRLVGALTAITAAVVGVIANLSIWFALHVFFQNVTREIYGPITLWRPEIASLDWRVVALATLCGFLMLKLHWDILRVLLIAASLGVALNYLT